MCVCVHVDVDVFPFGFSLIVMSRSIVIFADDNVIQQPKEFDRVF